ncbi:MAG: cytochrome C oxidase subunit IV family protein [Planctomycetota bacterium]|nr:cytochrome C oxidase subunit IV family protein [Planctomycetota bacterium]
MWSYFLIYSLLMVLLIATVVVAQIDLGHWNFVLSMLIAVIKALLVILFFMHVKNSSGLTWIFAAAAFLWLSLLLGLTMTDYATRTVVPAAMKGPVVSSPEQGHIPQPPPSR